MAVRTVSVELKMQIADFLRGAGEASAATKLLGHEFEDLGKKSDKFSTTKPSKEMQNFSRVLNSSLKDGKTGFESIQSAIDDTKTHIAGLQHQIKTGSGSESLFGDLKSAKKDLRTLEGIFKDLTPAASEGGTEAGSSFLKSFATEAVKLGDVAMPVGIAFGAAIALVAVPVVVSALTAGVAGAIGLGVIAAGALIERNDPVIQAALAPLAKTISSTLAEAASPLQQAFEDAIRSADLFVAREGPALKGMFASVAPAVGLVVGGIEHLVADLLPQFTAIGKEFSKALANPQVHAALVNAENDFVNLFKVIGNNPQVIAVGFETIGKAVSFVSGFLSGLINITGHVINGFDDATTALSKFFRGDQRNEAEQLKDPLSALSLAFPELAKQAQYAQGPFTGLFTQIGKLATVAATSGFSFSKLAGDIHDLGETADYAAKIGLQNLLTQELALSNAQLGFNQSILDSVSTLKAGKNSLNEHTAAGIADNQAINNSIGLNLAQFDASLKAGNGTDTATSAYNRNLDALEANLKKHGELTAGVYALIESYRKVPDEKKTTFNAPGLKAAEADAGEYGQNIRNIPSHKTTVITTYYRDVINSTRVGSRGDRWGNLYQPAADGLLSSAQVYSAVNPGRFMIAEPQTGGEAFIPKNGDYGRSMSILSAAAGWYGAHVVGGNNGGSGGPISITITASDPQAKAFLAAARLTVQQNGGDPVKVFTPR